MDITKLNKAMKCVDDYIVANSAVASTDLQKQALAVFEKEYPKSNNCNINIGYSDDFRTKIFYLDLANEGKILAYSRALNKIIEVNAIPKLDPLVLSGCQKIVIDFLRKNNENHSFIKHIDNLIKGDFKERIRYFLPLISCYTISDRNDLNALVKEFLSIVYKKAILG